MSFFGALDRSASCSISRRMSSRSLLLTFLCPKCNIRSVATSRKPLFFHAAHKLNQNVSYNASGEIGAPLVDNQHGTSEAAAKRLLSRPVSHGKRTAKPSPNHVRKWSSSTRCQSLSQPVFMQASREDFKDLIDHYYDPLDGRADLQCHVPPTLLFDTTTVKHESFELLSASDDKPRPAPSSEEDCSINRFTAAMAKDNISNDDLFEIYKTIPRSSLKSLPAKQIRRLLHRLIIVEKRNERTMLQYLSIVDDMKDAGIPLTSGEWSSAIAFVGRCYTKVSAADVRSALYIWKEMEADAGVTGTNVTFNILFDIAVKAGKYGLADMILKEMHARRLEFNRFTRVGLIFYYGLRGDGDSIRKAYRELVDAGEIVDTVVLNCVIASLLRAGEAGAAEQVFGRMMKLHAKQAGTRLLPPRDWRTSRRLGRVLARASRFFRDKPEARMGLQASSPVAPDLRTFCTLLTHHALETGDVDKLSYFLDEMRYLEIPVHGRIFLILFQGFAVHGSKRYSSWTTSLLETVMDAFLQALQDRPGDIFWSKWMTVRIVRAFNVCAGQQRALEIWQEILSRWQPRPEELDATSKLLCSILTQPESASSSGKE
ncbi:hypothetical protein L228DRAFT_244624 [Xylona heveae TC161]|uniref:Pentatricopeptide repeat protein n=1 Tax=Xylona heveae (strain CBS 132557 / TC161) TaxID=1328760 RepID=A0A165J4R0_XYLHT|nr:hypothetical protein L228DRAFT_244624 [Xylona heveae TC161]KZF25730.1 hypothetical protein L228DRAFT_244624 [Xylona heveae TC161]